MNNVIRATTAIMGIIRYSGLHVRQQTTRLDARTCVRARGCACAPTCESRALFLLRRVSPRLVEWRECIMHTPDAPTIGVKA